MIIIIKLKMRLSATVKRKRTIKICTAKFFNVSGLLDRVCKITNYSYTNNHTNEE